MTSWAALALLVSLLAQPALKPLDALRGPDTLVRFDPQLRNAADQTASAFPALRREVEKSLGLELSVIPQIVLLRESREFQLHVESSIVTAFAEPRKGLIVIDYGKMTSEAVLSATLKHEAVHLILGGGEHPQFPKWFDEGTAQWASGGIADILNAGAEDVLRKAVLASTVIPLSALERSFPRDQEQTLLAYQEGKSMVEYLVKEYGADKLRELIRSVHSGTEFGPAVRRVFGAELPSLEQEWNKLLTRRYAWPAYVADHLSVVLFLVAAVVTIAGYLRFRKRLRDYRDDDEEADDDSGPEPQ